MPAETKTYLSPDSVTSDKAQNYFMEFKNFLTPGMLPHCFNLNVEAIIMLLRKVSITQRLCNGTHLKVVQLHDYHIKESIIGGFLCQTRVLIPKIKLTARDENIRFVFQEEESPTLYTGKCCKGCISHILSHINLIQYGVPRLP